MPDLIDELRVLARKMEGKAAAALALKQAAELAGVPRDGANIDLLARTDAAARIWQKAADMVDGRARALAKMNKGSRS